ncbi:MAG TPA: hypothetical protein VMB26_02890, partial [Candidatus Binataceae bacterium]|nr:hypothetical protein [Candidatus Binataceae bacterium]
MGGRRKVTELSSYRGRKTPSDDDFSHISPTREKFIRGKARELLIRAWRRVAEVEGRKIAGIEMLPIEPHVIAQTLDEWSFEEPDEIGRFIGKDGTSREIAGMIERPERRITVARKLPLPVKRFTGA